MLDLDNPLKYKYKREWLKIIFFFLKKEACQTFLDTGTTIIMVRFVSFTGHFHGRNCEKKKKKKFHRYDSRGSF